MLPPDSTLFSLPPSSQSSDENSQYHPACHSLESSQVCMHVHHPITSQLEPHEADLIAANGLYRRGTMCQVGGGMYTSGEPRAKSTVGTCLHTPTLGSPLPASAMQTPQDASLWCSLHRENTGRCYREVGVRKPSFLPWSSTEESGKWSSTAWALFAHLMIKKG